MRQGFPRTKAWSQDIPRDTIPAMMRPGEGVLVPEATQAMGGARGINFINRAAERGALNVRFPRMRHFDQGGVVHTPDWIQEEIGRQEGQVTPEELDRVYKAHLKAMEEARARAMNEPQSVQHFQDGGTVPLVQPQARIERYSLTGRMPDNTEFSDNSSLPSLAHPKTDLEYKLLQPGQLYIDPDDHKVYRKGYAQPTVI